MWKEKKEGRNEGEKDIRNIRKRGGKVNIQRKTVGNIIRTEKAHGQQKIDRSVNTEIDR